MKTRAPRILLASAVGLALAAGVAWWQTRHVPDLAAVTTAIGGPFTLTDHTGRRVTDADFTGRYRLIYFGYTYCPDVCPTELQAMSTALDRLGADGERLQPLFITIDPARDTPAHLADYVALFHPRLIGLTGSAAEIAAAARAYRVYYARPPGGDDQTYLMDHSSFVYLMGPDGQFLTAFPSGVDPEKMAAGIKARLQ
ncbi:MAG: redoxin domain-containing protein [Azospirillum sp.]|nr:redoxin domain-containing protein [Azospirillum sp.]